MLRYVEHQDLGAAILTHADAQRLRERCHKLQAATSRREFDVRVDFDRFRGQPIDETWSGIDDLNYEGTVPSAIIDSDAEPGA